jgi:hypothetical protein
MRCSQGCENHTGPDVNAFAKIRGSILLLPCLAARKSPGQRYCRSDARGLAKTIQPVAQAQHRMLPNHPRACVAHHNARLPAAPVPVTADGTSVARGLFPSETTAFQPHGGVGQKSPALRAQSLCLPMMVAAVDPHHRRNRPPFPREPACRGMLFKWRGRNVHFWCGQRFNDCLHGCILLTPMFAAVIQVKKTRFFPSFHRPLDSIGGGRPLDASVGGRQGHQHFRLDPLNASLPPKSATVIVP